MFEKKINEMTIDERNKADQIILQNGSMLQDLYIRITEQTIKTLFIINGGGIIATLTFVHESKHIKNLLLLLLSFLIGLFFAILIVGFNYFISLNQFIKFHSNILNFKKNNNKFNSIIQNPTLKTSDYIIIMFGILSGLLFFIGSITAIYSINI